MKLAINRFKTRVSLPAFNKKFFSSPWVKYLALGIVFYCLFLIASIPATWLSWGLSKYSNGVLAITQPEGSLWSGQGHVIASYMRSSPHDFGLTEWSINPLWWLTGRLQLDLRGLDKDLQADIRIRRSFSGTTLRNSRLLVPASFIAKLYAPAGLFSPEGRIEVHASTLSLSEDGLGGRLVINWSDAGSALSPVKPLGDYSLVLEGKGKTGELKLTTRNGDLELTGQGKWNVTGNGLLSFNGTANPRTRKSELEPLLKLLGRDLGNGRRLLRFNTRISLIKSKNKK
ncbi:MAG: type II secretion system protein N [Gammaproteobacteria bacterium]|nr:MAG: type II secretion system protein N [Gammaproteobacteria bacterium]